mmetsp:Transcript_20253/g.37792  ORF Transcript_20253/g.37792 Transcript_20253/m.37792 type:complete len:348 (+) Transcript_20253:7646-8689(+)
MFIKKKLYPSPWEEPKRTLTVKDNNYFHTKQDLWNSPYHTSPKMAKFYQPELPSHTPSPPTEAKPIAEISRVESRERFKRRLVEREQLQLKAQQRVFKPEVLRSYTPDYSKTTKSGFDDPKEHRTQNVNSWNKLNTLPPQSVQKVLNEFIIKKDKEAVKAIQDRINEEKAEQDKIKDWLTINRSQVRASFSKIQLKNTELQHKAGVQKPANMRSVTSITRSERIARLSTPKNYKKLSDLQLEPDFRGLITVDFRPAEMICKGERPQTVKEFPVPWSLYSTVKSTGSKIAEELQATHTPNCEDDSKERRYIAESMEQLSHFNALHGDVKGRVGFPRIHLEQLKLADKT